MSSNLKYGTGRNKFIGQSVIYPIPIPLNPKEHFGAVVCASDGQLYYSDGELWVIPVDTSDISRPQAIQPTNADEATRLTLTTFRSARGYDQTGILFHISTSGGPSFNTFISKVVDSPIDNFYQILEPEDGFSPGDEIWWRGKYLGTNNTQSAFSLPYRQIFPNLIETPEPVTGELSIVGNVEITPFDVTYTYAYVETQFEFYNETGDTLLKTVTITSLPGNLLNIPSDLQNKGIYQFRARYGARIAFGAPTEYSEWSEKRKFVNGMRSILLEYDTSKMVANTIGVPLGGSGVNVTIDWGDGSVQNFTTAGVKRHTYAPETTGNINVAITGTLSQYGSSSVTRNDQAALIRVNAIGYGMGLTSLSYAFANTSVSLSYITPEIPPEITNMSYAFSGSATIADLRNLDVSNITNMSYMFFQSIGSGPLMDGWNTSSVTNMSYMFYGATAFNRPIGNWDTSNVTNMSSMFQNAPAFNQPIGNWDTSKVTNMTYMFYLATVFNQPIGNWDTSKVTNMTYMFSSATTFNQQLDNWNTSSVTNMSYMFSSATTFNQQLDNWNTSNVNNMISMFSSATNFNQPIGNWNTSSVTNMSSMFYNARNFNQPIGNWNTSKVTNMSSMFSGAANFNQPIGDWDTSNVTNMSNMFSDTYFGDGVYESFNQPIGNWNTSNVTNMGAMFYFARDFNQPIGDWDTSNVTNMSNMFYYARKFNRPIGDWNTSKVTNMNNMFYYAATFNQPIGNWDTSNVTNMISMLHYATTFNQDISKWTLNKKVALSWIIESSGMSSLNLSRLYAGWADSVYQTDGPNSVAFAASGLSYSPTLVVKPTGYFTTAGAGRTFLTKPRSYEITNAINPTANGIYAYNSELDIFINSTTNWFLQLVVESSNQEWALIDDTGDIRSVGTGTSILLIDNWTNALVNAVLLNNGAGWTITGDRQA